MTKIKTDQLVFSDDIIESFQRMVELLSDIFNVEYAGMIQSRPPNDEVCHNRRSNKYNSNQKQALATVINSIIPNNIINSTKQLKGSHQQNNISYFYTGYALLWPDGTQFGVLAIIDRHSNKLNLKADRLLFSFKESIDTHLKNIFQQAKLTTVKNQLKLRSDNRTQNIANLNYTLSQEIDKRKAAEQEIAYHKNHDIGTGFLNQFSLLRESNRLLIEAKNNLEHIAIIQVTFSNGRKLQERYGEHALSNLLIAFRERIGQIDCIQSVTARTSISNFIMVIRTKSLTPFIDNFCYRCLEICHSDFPIENDRVHLHGFVGVSTSIDSDVASDLIYFANEAVFSSKETGQKYCYYSETHTEQRIHTNEIERYLLQAVRNDDLKLYFQPQVDLKTGDWIGAEALIRWNHPVLGTVSNENLIQLAEQNGLIFEVGNFVLRSAIENACEWRGVNDNFKVAVNVSSVQLKNVDFIEHIEHLLETYQFPANKLEIELTESCLISDEYLAKKTLHGLNQLGVTLSLDDFGTGCASFSYLKNYPFNSLKIDKSFVQNLIRNPNDKEIVRSIVQIAKKLDLLVTIEGVENLDQERFVLSEGCDFAQGYLYGKPMTGEEFKQCINK